MLSAWIASLPPLRGQKNGEWSWRFCPYPHCFAFGSATNAHRPSSLPHIEESANKVHEHGCRS
ncbi:hypothetical protein EVA_10187 [gut metagenome]|uniref:Uncharacterized protein n=1 Tax=gut metagenome TaxID=749906 RepID=J9GID6_9ZZZZ